jgi:uncharacterized protein involved in exopolysaccharide biosynthesis
MRDHEEPAAGPGAASPGPLRAHAIFITIFVLSAALTALAMTYIYPERYAAETTIFFKPANILKLSESQVQALGSPVPNTPFKVISQSLNALVKSDSLLRQVVLDLSLQRPQQKTVSPIWYVRLYNEAKDWLYDYGADAWSVLKYGRMITPDRTDQAIAALSKGLKIVNEDSYVFRLTARWKTPEAAAAIANTVASKVSELLRQDDRQAADQEHQQVRALLTQKFDEITRLEDEIRDLLLSNGVGSVQAAIEQATDAYAQLQLSRADASAELSQQEARLYALANKVHQEGMPPISVTAVDGLEQPRARGQLTTNEYSRLLIERQTTEVNVNGLKARVANYNQTTAQMEQDIAKLTRMQAEYGALSQRLEADKRDYTALRDVLAESTVRASDFQGELRVTSLATPDSAPVSPIKIYHVGLAVSLALLLACGLAYLLSYFDIRLFLPRPKGGDRGPGPELAAAAAARTAHPLPATGN